MQNDRDDAASPELRGHSESLDDLVRRTSVGDRVALVQLMERHLPALRAFIRLRLSPELRHRESASDIVQSACADVLGDLERFQYRGAAAFRGYLFTAVWNKLRNRERDARAEKRDVRREVAGGDAADNELAACYAATLSPSQNVLAEERARELEAAFDELPDAQREVLTLSRIARLPRAEIARQLERTEDSVRGLLTRALVALSEALERRGMSP